MTDHSVNLTPQGPPRTVLPLDLFEKYRGLSFWRDPKGSQAFRITVQTPEPDG